MLPNTGYINWVFIMGIALVALIALRLAFVLFKRRKNDEE